MNVIVREIAGKTPSILTSSWRTPGPVMGVPRTTDPQEVAMNCPYTSGTTGKPEGAMLYAP